MSRRGALGWWIWFNAVLANILVCVLSLIVVDHTNHRAGSGGWIWMPIPEAVFVSSVVGCALLVLFWLIEPHWKDLTHDARTVWLALFAALLVSVVPWWINVASPSLVGFVIIGAVAFYVNAVIPALLLRGRWALWLTTHRTTQYNEDGLAQREAALRAEIEHLERIAQEAGR